MFGIQSLHQLRLLSLIGGLTLSASLVVAQPPANAPKSSTSTNTTKKTSSPAAKVPTSLPSGSGFVRVQSTAPAELPESVPNAPATPASAPSSAANAPAAAPSTSAAPVSGEGCPNGGCVPTGKTWPGQPTDPCSPVTSWGPEIPVLPVNRNTGTGADGLGFGPCRLPCVPGAGTGVTFKQCLNNAINIKRTPAIMANPNGTFTRMAFERQRVNALAEYFVMYKEEFVADGTKLTDSGFRHLCGIVKRFEDCRPMPIQIEVVDAEKKVAEARKLAVVEALMKLGIDATSAIARVQAINYCGPRAEPLRYEAVERVGNAALQSSGNQLGTFGFGGLAGIGGIGGFGGFR